MLIRCAHRFRLLSLGLLLVPSLGRAETPGAPLFHESFDDTKLLDRGWYDGRSFEIVHDGATSGGCIEYRWNAGDTTPTGSSGARRLFEPTDRVYLRFYLKLSPNWGWTDRGYHPHFIQFLTDQNDKYRGPASSRLTLYVEPHAGKLRLAAQDIQNQDAPSGLTQGPLRGGYNGKFFDSDEIVFKNDVWHLVEAEFRLNSLNLADKRPKADGVAKAWVDGKLVVDRSDLIFRSADFPDMKFNQFLLLPYFGPGLLPRAQGLLVDELTVARSRADVSPPPTARKIRAAAAQPRNRTIDFRLPAAAVLAKVDQSLDELEGLIRKAGEAGCDVLAFPEDTLGLLNWEAAHPDSLADVLPTAVPRMLERLGRAAAKHKMMLVLCNDVLETDGRIHNTAFFLGRDGKEIGRYHKVNLPLIEQSRTPGKDFPVFPGGDLGTVGMLICYDMVFPEAARCLALNGADVVFHPTLGGAAMGDEDISLAAFRTRAVENFVYLIVAQRGDGSMIISPKGKILATAKGLDSLAIAEIDPFGGREAGDAFNTQADMRGRLFRERVPAAYRVLTDPNPAVLAKVPSNVTKEEAIRIMSTVLTTGEERFKKAEALARSGDSAAAIRLFEQLCVECRTSWVERASRARLQALRAAKPAAPKAP